MHYLFPLRVRLKQDDEEDDKDEEKQAKKEVN